MALVCWQQQRHRALVLQSPLVALQTHGTCLAIAVPFPEQAGEALEAFSVRALPPVNALFLPAPPKPTLSAKQP